MSKQIMITDDLYERLREQAEKNFRSIGGQIEFYIANGGVMQQVVEPPKVTYTTGEWKEAVGKMNLPNTSVGISTPPPDGYPCCKLKTPCKHWVFDSNLGRWENTLTGDIRQVD